MENYEKTEDGKLKVITTVEKEEQHDLTDLKRRRSFVQHQRDVEVAQYDAELAKLDKLIEEADKLGIEEKVREEAVRPNFGDLAP